MINLQKLFDRGDTLREKLESVLTFLTDSLQIPDLYFVDREDRMKSVADETLDIGVSGIRELMIEDLYTASTVSDTEKVCPLLCEALRGRNIESVMIVRIGSGPDADGFLVCGVKRRFRIWQENECAIMYFLSNLISGYLRISGK